MATYNKQIEKWMSRASFDALDKSTIPEGTEINIVGDIQESDLSLELQNKINGVGHCWKLTLETGEDWYGTLNLYAYTKAGTIEALANDLIVQTHGNGDMFILPNTLWNNSSPIKGFIHYFINSCSVNSSNTISLFGNFVGFYHSTGSNPAFTTGDFDYLPDNKATVTKLW